jgi:hypothetical protein
MIIHKNIIKVEFSHSSIYTLNSHAASSPHTKFILFVLYGSMQKKNGRGVYEDFSEFHREINKLIKTHSKKLFN